MWLYPVSSSQLERSSSWAEGSREKALALGGTLLSLDWLELELDFESHVICDICHVTIIESYIHILYYHKLTDQQFGAMQPNVWLPAD